jgi:hypothetical protein
MIISGLATILEELDPHDEGITFLEHVGNHSLTR